MEENHRKQRSFEYSFKALPVRNAHEEYKKASRIKALPKAKAYRSTLEPLLNKWVVVICDHWVPHEVTRVDGVRCRRICAINPSIRLARSKGKAKAHRHVEHLNLSIPLAVPLKYGQGFICRALVGVYETGGQKNIGVAVDAITLSPVGKTKKR